MTHIDAMLLHLSLIDGVGPALVAKLVDQVTQATDLYACSVYDLQAVYNVSEVTATKIVAGLKDMSLLEKECALLHRHNISWVTIADAAYPTLLRHIHCPPAVLYYRGTPLDQFVKSVAIVGARKAQPYAQKVIQQLMPSLVRNGWCIVSGGALGADTMAHTQALKADGKTVAVLGSGLLRPYPHANRKLFDTIVAQGGTLVSSFPVLTEPFPGNFPARNRIIAGLSKGCIVVQAAKKSGARITASFALDQGRSVFAVPGSMLEPLSDGCHALIKEGATIVLSARDLMVELGEQSPKEAPVVACQQTISDALGQLDPEATLEQKILHYAVREAVSIDDLMQYLAVNMVSLQEALFDMQLENKVRQNGAGLWQAIES